MVAIIRNVLSVVCLSLVLAFGAAADRADSGSEAPARSDQLFLTGETNRLLVTNGLEIATGMDPNLTLEQVAGGVAAGHFRAAGSAVPQAKGNRGDTWFRFELANLSDRPQDVHVRVRFPYLELIEFASLDGGGIVTSAVRGASLAYDEDTLTSHVSVFPLRLEAGETRSILSRVRSDTIVLLPIEVMSEEGMLKATMQEMFFLSAVIGVVLAIGLHSLFLYVGTRRRVILTFAVYALASSLYLLVSSGVGQAVFWSGVTLDSSMLLLASQGIVLSVAALFLREFLEISNTRTLEDGFVVAIAAAGLSTVFASWLPPMAGSILFLLATVLGPAALLALTVDLLRRGNRNARIAALGWAFSQISTIWLCLRVFDLVPYIWINHFLIPVGCTISVMVFSWALSREIGQNEAERLTDPLTGIANRRALNLYREHSATRSSRMMVAVFDLDLFKPVNDLYGHAAGDFVLRHVASLIAAAAGSRDMVARLGGDEFVLVHRHGGRREEAVRLVRSLHAAINADLVYQSEIIACSASCGVAFAEDCGGDLSDALAEADRALYRTKAVGGRGLRFAEDQDRREAPVPDLADDLADATDGDRADGFARQAG